MSETAMAPLRRYTFKLYPSRAQEAALREQARMCAELWNALLEMRETFFRRAKQRGDKRTSLTAFDQGKDITALRAELAEWRAMPRGTQERVADMLDLAFKAFFRRAKAGAGAQSGYPRFKRTRDAESVPLREPVKSCWIFTPLGNGWRLKMRGIPGAIRARGKFPAAPDAFKTADVKFYDDAWWFSVCVAMPESAVRPACGEAFRVEFDLIDEFASVKDADGRCAPGLTLADFQRGKGEFSHSSRVLSEGAGVQPSNEGGAQGLPGAVRRRMSGVQPSNEGGAQVNAVDMARSTSGVQPSNEGGAQEYHFGSGNFLAGVQPSNEGKETQDHLEGLASSIQSSADRRYRKFSLRWKRQRRRVAHIQAVTARRQSDLLHRWTTAIVHASRSIEILAPNIKDNIQSGRGDAKNHGAEVSTIATLNRAVLARAPGAAIAMLEYKAAAAGVPCAVTRMADHPIAVGRDLRSTAITGRIARRLKKKEAA